jgi:ABC-type multidrug transport system fused ATPase/permease subunit
MNYDDIDGTYEPPSMGNYDDRLDELRRREEELERKEQEFNQREGAVANAKPPNWPFCKPFLYHDIYNAIQPGLGRRITYLGYVLWILFSVATFLNFCVAVVTVCMPVPGTKGITNTLERVQFVLFAGLIALVTPAAHFVLSYWQLYTAQVELTIGRFMLFFLGYGIAILFGLFLISGWYNYGPCGIVVAILYFPTTGDYGPIVAFCLNLFMATIWAVFTLIFIVIFIINIKLARQQNHSFNKAVEFTKGAAVGLVGKAATTAVSGTMRGENEV